MGRKNRTGLHYTALTEAEAVPQQKISRSQTPLKLNNQQASRGSKAQPLRQSQLRRRVGGQPKGGLFVAMLSNRPHVCPKFKCAWSDILQEAAHQEDEGRAMLARDAQRKECHSMLVLTENIFVVEDIAGRSLCLCPASAGKVAALPSPITSSQFHLDHGHILTIKSLQSSVFLRPSVKVKSTPFGL
jgi:hypothetical protein